MQQLFLMFPAGRAGVALLLLRFAVIAALFIQSSGCFGCSILETLAVCVATLSLLLGAVTPICAAICSVVQLVSLIEARYPLYDTVAIFASAALALIGPGAYSLDSIWFGRRLVVLSDSRDRRDR